METANPSGAVENTASIHERILAKLSPAPVAQVTPEPIVTEKSEQVIEDAPPVEAMENNDVDQPEIEKPQEEPTAPSFQSVDELAEALDMSPEDFAKAIKAKIKIDGQESEVTLEELRAGYQKESDYRKKTGELAEHRRALEQQTEQFRAESQNRLGHVNTLIDNLQNQILGEFQNIDWNSLRVNDPGEYAARVQEFQSRQQHLEKTKGEGQQEAQRLQQEQQAKQAENYKAFLAQEEKALLVAIPAWQDQEILKQDTTKLRDFLSERGFNINEIGNAIDHRIIKMAYDLMTSGVTKQKTEIVKNKIKDLPKLVKPGAKQTINANAERAQKLKARVKSGDRGALHELLKQRIK